MPAPFRTAFTVALFLLVASVSLAYEPYRVGGNVMRPEKISGQPPVYTEAARKAGVEGVVIVETIIDERGDVVNLRTLKGLPEGLDQAAMDAVETWKFKPATLDGQPVKVYYTLTVNFIMENKVEGLVVRVLNLLLDENPELESLMWSKRFPEALAYLESRPPTPEIRAGRCVVLVRLYRFDEALTEARAYDGPDPDQILHHVALTALQAMSHVLTEQARAGILDAGIQAATDALGIRGDCRQAMFTKSSLLREKAKLATDPQRAALRYEAEDLEKRAMALPQVPEVKKDDY